MQFILKLRFGSLLKGKPRLPVATNAAILAGFKNKAVWSSNPENMHAAMPNHYCSINMFADALYPSAAKGCLHHLQQQASPARYGRCSPRHPGPALLG
jgi:hypothetical protein